MTPLHQPPIIVELLYDCELCGVPCSDEDSYWAHAENAHTPDEWEAYAEELIEWLTSNPATIPWEPTLDATALGVSATLTSNQATSTPYSMGPRPLAS